MKFIQAPQRSDDWFKARLGRVTGSRMKDVVARAKRPKKDLAGNIYYPYLETREKYKRELVAERIAGQVGQREVFVTPEMQWGQMNENTARTIYSLQTGHRAIEEGFCQHDELMAGVSTDGLADDKINLEIKALVTRNHLYEIVKQKTLPDDFRDQVQMQLWITEREKCHFIGYDSRVPAGLDLFVIEVPRDELYIQMLEEETKLFLAEVDADMAMFLRYLPVCERVCTDCGLIFTDKIALCPTCGHNKTRVQKVLQEAELKLFEKGKIPVLEKDFEGGKD